MNEILIALTLVLTFASVLIWFRMFGKSGMFALTAFITIAANIEVAILVDAFGIEMTLGNMLFAGTFLATDILSEVYGKKEASKCVGVGIVASLSMIVLTNVWMLYTPSANDFVFPAITTVFSNTPRILIASLLVYAICQVVDVHLYHFIWKITGKSDKHMWLRNNIATVVSQALNAVLFNFAAFYGTVPMSTMWSIIVANCIITLVTSLLDTPVLYFARHIARKHHYGKYS